MKNPELSIILPCRNEEQALPRCLEQIKKVILQHEINAEIIVSDSSTDKSPEIAKKHKVRLVKHDKKGYGIAYMEGFKVAKGKFILMADADCTYDFNDIPKFLYFLRQGYDLVVGNRFGKKLKKGVMPLSHKYIGNPILSTLLRIFFKTNVRDAHCGIRAIRKKALDKLELQTTGMEFSSEMIIKATKRKLKIKQFAVDYYPRIGDSKLNTARDGWRHLRFMLLYSPFFLFFLPGLLFFTGGSLFFLIFTLTNPNLFGVTFYIHPQFINSALIIIGYQLIFFFFFAKTYLITHLAEPEPKFFKNIYKRINLETGIIYGILLTLLGIIIFLLIVIFWLNNNLKQLNQINNSLIALNLVIIGVQTIFNSFMLSVLGIENKTNNNIY